MSKENKIKSWPEVIAKARQIEDLKEKLNYLVQNQPHLLLHPDLASNKLIVRPEYWEWWVQNDSDSLIPEKYRRQRFNKSRFVTVKDAIRCGTDLEKVVIGFYLAQPWSWEDGHIFGDEEERAKDIVCMVTNSR